MNFDMFSNNQPDDMDPNYIYPRPYLDPMMFFNPYAMNYPNQMNPQMNMANYMTYMNPQMSNPFLGQDLADGNLSNYQMEEDDMDDIDDVDELFNNMHGSNMQGMSMPGMPQGMMMPQMMPGMPQGMMMPMMPGMMMPGMMMPGMNMYPFMQMMPGMEAINIEEFDEEEM